MSIDVYGKWADPRQAASRANTMAMAHAATQQRVRAGANPHGSDVVPWHPGTPNQTGWYGADWMNGRSPQETARLRDRFENFLPKMAGRGGMSRADDFFHDILPQGANLAPNAGAGLRQSQQKAVDMRRRAGPMGMPGGGQLSGNNVFQHTQQPYQPEYACGRGDSSVVMYDGARKALRDVVIGDRVLDRVGAVQTVENAWCSGTPDEVVEITTWGSKKFYFTKNHRWPVWAWCRTCLCGCGGTVTPGRLYVQNHYNRNDRVKAVHVRGSEQRTGKGYQCIPEGYEPLQKIPAAEIREGDFLLIPRKFDPVETNTTEEEARVLGYYVAEGSFDYGPLGIYDVAFNFGEHERETWVVDVRDCLQRKGIATSTPIPNDENGIALRTTNDYGANREATVKFAEWCRTHGGEHSLTKRLSEEVMRWPVKLKRELLRGMFRGDGSQTWRISTKKGFTGKSFGTTYSTSSPILAGQVQLLLAQLGYPSRITTTPAGVRKIRGRQVFCAESYMVVVPAPFAFDFANYVWGEASAASKFERKNNVRPECMVDDDFIYVPVKSVRVIANAEPVYNLTVSGDHSYLVDNIATYNSPDRQNYPVHRNLANIYWRLFYKLDYVFGSGVDLYAELPWGDVEFTGEGFDGEIKDQSELMWEVCNIRSLLPYFVREHMVLGETCIQNYYDQNAGIWTYTTIHNPDQLEVIYTPFVKMDPIVRFKPDNRLQQVLSAGSESTRMVRESMPPALLSAMMSGQAIELDPLNFTFLPRKMHPYDVRGTSIASRMWRIFMLEDAIYNASIAVARRASSPLKVAMLGDPTTGWIPDPSHEARLLELLAQAEIDPTAWLIYHYGIKFDLVGVQERTWKIEQSAEFIERVKLMALGLSKSFLWGEVTFASAQSGLTVFLQRLRATREYFESSWIVPKFFKPVAVMNGWVKPTPAELAHGVRTRRSKQELLEDGRYITPTLEWVRPLDPSVEQAQITALNALQGLGVTFSKQYLASLAGRDWEEELKQRGRETVIEQELIKQYPALQTAMQPPGEGGGAGGGGGGVLPGLPPSSMGFEEGGPPGGEPPPPPEAGIRGDAGDSGAPGGGQVQLGNWEAPVVYDLLHMIGGDPPDEDVWRRAIERPRVRSAIESGDAASIWEELEDYLVDEGYPSSEILTLKNILKSESQKSASQHVFDLFREAKALEEPDDIKLLVGSK